MRSLHVTLSFSLLASLLSVPAQAATSRPSITGVSNISTYTSNPSDTERFYVDVVGCAKAPDPENPAGQRYYVNSTQFVEVLPLPAGKSPASLDHVGYITSDARALRAYLSAHGVAVPPKVDSGSDGSRWFRVKDPEGNVVEFVQNPAQAPSLPAANPIGRRIIHVGFVVHSSETENPFYRGLLGFRPYWFGGMQSGKIDWVSQQVPDGSDWLEYMLTSGPSGSGIPASVSERQLGVMDHFSIGVPDMASAVATLKTADRLTGRHDENPKIGKDGKWQFNMYAPDDVRVELMEFKNVQEPCCSPFTASNPTPSE